MTPRASECFSHSGKLNQQLRSLLRDGPLVHNQPHLCPCRHFWGAVPLLGLCSSCTTSSLSLSQKLLLTGLRWLVAAPTHLVMTFQKHQQSMGLYVITRSVWPQPQSIPSGRMANSTGNMDHTSSFQWQLCHTSLGGVPLADLSLYSTIKRKKWKIEACFQNRALRNSENSDSTDFHMIYLN